jgi:hypothetical protein
METQCKLLFEVEYDENEIIKETVWAFVLGNNEYRIDSIPFYAYSVALGDIFSAEEEDGFLLAKNLVSPSGNSTIRLLFNNTAIIQATRAILEQNYGCESEISNVTNLISVNIPFDKNYKNISIFLQDGENLEKWQYEEGCLSDEHKALIL